WWDLAEVPDQRAVAGGGRLAVHEAEALGEGVAEDDAAGGGGAIVADLELAGEDVVAGGLGGALQADLQGGPGRGVAGWAALADAGADALPVLELDAGAAADLRIAGGLDDQGDLAPRLRGQRAELPHVDGRLVVRLRRGADEGGRGGRDVHLHGDVVGEG